MPTRLILIRHGQTDWSRQGRYCSLTDISLNNKGKEQIKKVRNVLNREKIDKICSSDAKRAAQSARLVFKGRKIDKFPELCEMNFGVFEGLRYRQIMKSFPKIYKKWLSNPCDIAIPNGESLPILAKRVRGALKKIMARNKGGTIAIFTHAGPISVILCDILGLGLEKIWQVNPSLASINIVEFHNG